MRPCKCTFGSVMYIISGIVCILDMIAGIITLTQVRFYPKGFKGPVITIGLLMLLPYLALTTIWGIGFTKANPSMKTSYAFAYMLLQLGLGSYYIVYDFYFFTTLGLVLIEVFHAAFVIMQVVGIFLLVREEREEIALAGVAYTN